MGEFQHSIDTKGRIIVPSKLRDQLGEKFVVTRGLDGCLFGYPLSEWEKLETKLDEMPLSKKDARTFVRFFYSARSEEHTSELQSRFDLVCRLLLEKKKHKNTNTTNTNR